VSVVELESRFATLKANARPALVIYLTVGYPSVDATLACARAAVEAGADVLELGVPFSDPTADGPVIARASHDAIRAGGSLRVALDVARRLSSETDARLVLFSYLNPIVAYGEEQLPRAAAEAGIDALLVVDLPADEGRALRARAREAGLGVVPLVAPTTGPERERDVVADARGFIYYVSLTGVTGSAEAPLVEAGRAARGVGERAKLPVVVGFGIDSPEKARAVADTGVAGVVVGSAVVKIMGRTAGDAGAVRDFVRQLRAALDAH